jgi:hypothetical protein
MPGMAGRQSLELLINQGNDRLREPARKRPVISIPPVIYFANSDISPILPASQKNFDLTKQKLSLIAPEDSGKPKLVSKQARSTKQECRWPIIDAGRINKSSGGNYEMVFGRVETIRNV